MYNEEYKQTYLDKREFNNNAAKTNLDLMFRKIEQWEIKYEKDLYDFSVREIISFYKSLCTSSLESLMVMNNQYKIYTSKALSEGLVKDNQNHYEEINNVQLLNCINLGLAKAQIISREELLHILRSSDLQNVSDQFLCLALFEGLGGKECTEITQLYPSNIKEGVAELPGGRRLTISPELQDWAMESADEYTYYSDTKSKFTHYMLDDTRILKRMPNSMSDENLRLYKSLKHRLDNIKLRTGCQAIGIATLHESGRLEKIRELMNNGRTLNEACKDRDMEYRYGKIASIPRYCLKYGLTEE